MMIRGQGVPGRARAARRSAAAWVPVAGLVSRCPLRVIQSWRPLVHAVGVLDPPTEAGKIGHGLDNIVAENAERNTDFMKLYFDNNEFQKAIERRRRAYRIVAEPARDEALARLRAEMRRETGGHPAGE